MSHSNGNGLRRVEITCRTCGTYKDVGRHGICKPCLLASVYTPEQLQKCRWVKQPGTQSRWTWQDLNVKPIRA